MFLAKAKEEQKREREESDHLFAKSQEEAKSFVSINSDNVLVPPFNGASPLIHELSFSRGN